ncbi:MAG TPA: glycosyltransferase family 1 protein [Candidatus Nitrosotalea sp.]|nr:glycosyltransferase family 1 protein [Candidatus Nitrosotalea sp.]
MAGLRVAVDGQALARPQAGMGVYTAQMLESMRAAEPQVRWTVWLPPELRGTEPPSSRLVPGPRLIGRHVIWPRRLDRAGADVFWGPAGQMPLGRLKAPAVLTVHDLAIYQEPRWFPSGQWLSVRLVVPRSLRGAEHLIAVSSSTAADLQRFFDIPEDRITVVPEGVAPSFRPLPPEALLQARRRWRLPERFILFVGTLEPRKNLTTLLEAWVQLPHRPPLVVVGGWGWRSEDLMRRVARAGSQLHLLGEVPRTDLAAIYNLAACLAHPAWYEGFGLTVLEAMACGVPVIASRTSSLPELVGGAGRLLPPDDVAAWTRSLQEVLGDPELRRQMRTDGLLRAAELTWDRAAERTLRTLAAAAQVNR